MRGFVLKMEGAVGVVVVVTAGAATLSIRAPSELRGIASPPSVVGTVARTWMALVNDFKALVLDGFLNILMA